MHRPGAADPYSVGLSYLIVQIDDVAGDIASVRDQFGKMHQIRILPLRGNGPIPQVGEVWVMDKALGQWTFAACMDPRPPVVVGSTDDIPALKSLITALAELGLIVDGTTNERIRANTPHTHSTPAGGSGPDEPTPEPA